MLAMTYTILSCGPGGISHLVTHDGVDIMYQDVEHQDVDHLSRHWPCIKISTVVVCYM